MNLPYAIKRPCTKGSYIMFRESLMSNEQVPVLSDTDNHQITDHNYQKNQEKMKQSRLKPRCYKYLCWWCNIKSEVWKTVILFTIIFITTNVYYSHKMDILAQKINRLEHEKSASAPRKMKRVPVYRELDMRLNASAYVYSLPRHSMCFFKEKLAKIEMPTIISVFSDPVTKSVVLTGVKFQWERWHKETFHCKYDNGVVTVADPIVNDFRSFGFLPQYVFVITCLLPDNYICESNFTMSLERVIPHYFKSEVSYENFTVCPSGELTQKKKFLAACTMVKDMDDFVSPWIEYHHFMGVEHFYIYDNQKEEESTLRKTVDMYIKKGIVTVIPWAYKHSKTKTYLEIQIAHENDCIWRHKHDTKWMMKIDVDEYIQPMNSTKPKITDYLTDIRFNDLGSIRVQNWFFGRPKNSEIEGNNVIERNRWRPSSPTEQNIGRDKNILQPMNVHYFKIHAIKLGEETLSVDPIKELRMVHYRQDNPRIRRFDLPNFTIKDESMVNIWNEIQKSKVSVS